MKKILVSLTLLIFICSHTSACDVNLFALISGSSDFDEFAQATGEIAASLKDIGQNFPDQTKARPLIKKLMDKWISYSTRFAYNPPDWAKEDKNWLKKMRNLADLIGAIQKNYLTNQRQAHIEVLAFSRRLTYLFEKKPLNPMNHFLLSFPQTFDELWQHYYDQNLEPFKESCRKLLKLCMVLPDYVPAKARRSCREFIYSAEELVRLAKSHQPFNSTTLYQGLTFSEQEFSELNMILAGAEKKDE